jgi:Holliday junction DNA helicase RuvA
VIAKLRGRLDSLGEAHAVLDVGGVGYLVFASSRTLGALGPVGGDVTVHTEMLVAQDLIRLVGFGSAGERDWFRLLTGVQGVGSKVALAILSALPADELGRAIAAGDHRVVAQAQGVGPKLAQRIVNELRDKAGGVASGSGPQPTPISGGHAQDAVSALLNLGFKAPEAREAVSAAQHSRNSGTTRRWIGWCARR